MDIGAFIAAAAVGVVVGVLSGLLGIGGGTMMVPLLRLGFGLEAIQATATSLFTIIPTSLSGCIAHVRNKSCVVPVGIAAGLGGALTSPVGVWLASMSPAWLIMTAAALIIGYSAFNMLRKAFKKPGAAPSRAAKAAAPTAGEDGARPGAVAAGAPGAPAGARSARAAEMAPIAAHAESSAFAVERKHLLTGAVIGLVAGLASGYVGVGGGFIMVPLFVSFLGLPMKKTSGTSLIAVTILAVPGVIEQAMLGHIDFVAGIAMAVGSIPGAVLGAQLMKLVPERALRVLFGVFLLIMAVVLVVNEFAAA